MSRPLGPAQAARLVGAFRSHPHWQLVDHAPEIMDEVWATAARAGFARTRIFDVRLALGLQRHGVTQLATRNVRDFRDLGFARVFDPLQ